MSDVFCIVDLECYKAGTLHIIKQMIEFGAPVVLHPIEDGEDFIEITGKFSHVYYKVTDQAVYQWEGPKPLTIWLKAKGLPEITVREED